MVFLLLSKWFAVEKLVPLPHKWYLPVPVNCSYAFSHTKVWVQGFEASVLRREERISFLTNDLSLYAWNFSKFLAWQQVTVIQITELQ